MKLSIQSMIVKKGDLIIEPTNDTKHIIYRLIEEYNNSKKPYVAEIGKIKKKRSLDSNSYTWVLITEIANILRSSKDEVYFKMLKRYGQGGWVSIQDKHVENFKRTWKYNESEGIAELNEKKFEHFRFWVGSSQYSTKEMSIFLDGIISECKEMGINTMTSVEIEQLNSLWKG